VAEKERRKHWGSNREMSNVKGLSTERDWKKNSDENIPE
jgi:hypothetical protein